MRSVAALLVGLSFNSMPSTAQAGSWIISNCELAEFGGKHVTTGSLQYTISKGAKVRKVKDVDYLEFRIASPFGEKGSFLRLSWGVNAAFSFSHSADNSIRIVTLPDGSGTDERGQAAMEGRMMQSRSVRVRNEFAGYQNATTGNAAYFDKIIDSACFASTQSKRK